MLACQELVNYLKIGDFMSYTNEINSNNEADPSQDIVDQARQALAAIYAKFDLAFQLADLLAKDSADMTKDEADLAAVQKALQELESEYHIKIDTDITHYKSDQDLCDKVESALLAKYKQSYNIPNGAAVLFHEIKGDEGYAPVNDAAFQDLYAKAQDFKKLSKEMGTIDAGVQDLINEIQALIASLAKGGMNHEFMKQDLATIMQYLTPLFQALKDRLHRDEDQELIKSGYLSSADVAKLFLDAIRFGSAEQSTLSDLEDQMTKDAGVWRGVEHKADENMADYNWWSHLKSFNNDKAQEVEERRTRSNAQMMEKIINSLMKGLGSEIGSIGSSGSSEIGMMLDEIMKQVSAILNDDKLSPGEKHNKVILLLGMLLSLIAPIQAQVATDRAEMDKKVAQAMQNAALTSMGDTLSQEQKIAKLRHQAQVMKVVLFAAKAVLDAIFMQLSPGVATKVTLAIFSALDLSGGVDGRSAVERAESKMAASIQNSLVNMGLESIKNPGTSLSDKTQTTQTNKILSEVVWGVVESAVLSISGGLDMLAADAAAASAKASVTAAIDASEMLIEQAVRQELQQTNANITEEIVKNAIAQRVDAIQDAAKLANQKIAYILVERSAAGSLAKLGQGAYAPAEEAVQQVIEEAIRDAEALSQKNIENTVNQAIADATKASKEDVEKATGNIGAAAAKRAGWFSVYSMANSNALVDLVIKEMKEHGAKENDIEKLMILMQVIQSLISMGSMTMALMGPQLIAQNLPGISTALSGTLTMSQGAAEGTSGVANFSMYTIDEQQARILPRVAKDKAAVEAFQLLLQTLSQNQQTDQALYSAQEAQTYKSSQKVIQDGLINNDGISSILASSV
jgi:hypothetical protein